MNSSVVSYALALLAAAAIPQGNGQTTYQGTIGAGFSLSGFVATATASSKSWPMSWSSEIGGIYSIETSRNLANWFKLPGFITATQKTTTRPVPQYEGEVRRFWREDAE